ncbi:allophanate hydrolase [Jannaschia pagri]|uniref:Allophanate hydrolase n=1 Tax=Jannaschia pagri TaxID=2829797 RepID=A0ABQ4NGN3_9RHOB|nr:MULTISPECIES: biotin-dependent carboxyltransferase family protein [unclassified Jannaschia]GIT90459.1 allophanate hydrolase [Jannaschia sp. AI_61]GIT93436.1 allophanate hydrolase [Jannaschia sp. AI_62]
MIEVLACGPMVSIQDDGRPGWVSQGLSQGGAADPMARVEAARLLGEAPGAGLESAGGPLRLAVGEATTLAFTGAPMVVQTTDGPLDWHACHRVEAGTVLDLRPGSVGVYSYVHVAGGLLTEERLGSRSAHQIAQIGGAIQAGERLPIARETAPRPSLRLSRIPDRFEGGSLRIVPTPQTILFPKAERDRFEQTTFIRDPRGNRQGIRLDMPGPGFATEGQLSLLSDFIFPGDLQMTGDGVPYILGPECQTTGGYPRIGTIIPQDLPRALQAPVGARLSFRFVSIADLRDDGPPGVEPRIRAPSEVPDLLAQQLIGGVVSARGDLD